jgi:hypothetical protein
VSGWGIGKPIVHRSVLQAMSKSGAATLHSRTGRACGRFRRTTPGPASEPSAAVKAGRRSGFRRPRSARCRRACAG